MFDGSRFDMNGLSQQVFDPMKAVDTALHGESAAYLRQLTRGVRRISPDIPTGRQSVYDLIEWGREHAPVSRLDAFAIATLHTNLGVFAVACHAFQGFLAEGVLGDLLPLLWQAASSPEQTMPRSQWIALADMADGQVPPATAIRESTCDRSRCIAARWQRGPTPRRA